MNRDQFSKIIQRISPLQCAFDWDNSGFNIIQHDDITRVFICLDASTEAVREAEKKGCDTILSHHPLLFHPLKVVDTSENSGKVASVIIKKGMNLYCAHTSFDCAADGMNSILADALELQDNGPVFDGDQMVGFTGNLKMASAPDQLALEIKKRLGSAAVRYSNDDKTIKRVLCIGGAGGDFYRSALLCNADALITGEVKYNHYADAAALGVSIFEAGHFETERIFVPYMNRHLQNIANELQLNIECFSFDAEPIPYKAV